MSISIEELNRMNPDSYQIIDIRDETEIGHGAIPGAVAVATEEIEGNEKIDFSKKLEIYPGADKTSLMVVLPHRPGSLYQILARFYALGLNLIKLESRPLPDREFEFMFYFDLETSVYSDEFIRMVDDLSAVCEEFQYLGSYSEVI